ncbi:hypothetical protein YC2023_086262 [Brassica napus]
MNAHQLRKAQESGCIYAYENLRSQFLSSVSSSLDVFDAATRAFLLPLIPLIVTSLKLDNDACAKTNFMTIPCWKDLIRLKIDHCYKIVEITDNPGKYLLD